MIYKKQVLCLLALLYSTVLMAQNLRFATVFTDNTVLQQNSKVKIWGYSKPNQSIQLTTSWNKIIYSTKTDESGKWFVDVQTLKAGFSVHTISVSNENKEQFQLKNILISEVWCCNMG